jgi:hypothetical protein
MMSKSLPPTNVFHISFNTMEGGYLKTVKITIENDVMDSMDVARIDLAEHPLYKDLQRYVLSNPR